jgi:DMSO reductase family type II enzyme heme b subunit
VRESPVTVERTAALYSRNCAGCHGEKGDGQGPAAYLLSPPPRDFTVGVYKFRSTPTGEGPTDDDLLRTLKHGVAGTAMPPWDRLPDEDLKLLVSKVRSFATEPEPAGSPISISPPPSSTPGDVAAGRVAYEQMQCFKCHGEGGKGDGPSADTLKDDWDRPIRPYDFTRGTFAMKGGARPEDVYRTFVTGLDGTPMPSFAESLGEDQRWQLVDYVLSLGAPGPALPAGTPSIALRQSESDPPADGDAAAWDGTAPTLVALRPLWAEAHWVPWVEVRAIRGPSTLSFRFSWPDERPAGDTARHEDFRDGVAVQFAPPRAGGDPALGLPFVGMGDAKDQVVIWHWAADRQADLVAGRFRDTQDFYTSMHRDQLDAREGRVEATSYFAGAAAQNPVSARGETSPCDVLVAKGLGSLTMAPAEHQLLAGKGTWKDGRWTIVIQRPLEDEFGPVLDDAEPLDVAVAVWNGEARDRDGQKAVSTWMELLPGG